MRLVLDSSVLIASVKPDEPAHDSARAFVERARPASSTGAVQVFAPPELWLEVHVVEQRLARSRRAAPVTERALQGWTIELVAPTELAAITDFLDLLEKRMRGRRPFANATDLVYLWVAWRKDATVVTLDHGMLDYHGVVCDLTRPQHVRIG
jgi:predicted nucleic acid-binding protein